jgi:glycine betaine/choline ABC-type transport system substrate-binding protein
MRIIDGVNRRLTGDQVIAMNRSVEIDDVDPATVAERFLRQNGLLRAQ